MNFTLAIHIAHKTNHIIKMFAIDPVPFLSQSLRCHFREIWTCAMRDVAICNTLYDIFLETMLIITPES